MHTEDVAVTTRAPLTVAHYKVCMRRQQIDFIYRVLYRPSDAELSSGDRAGATCAV
jgi:hypothetical protein